MKNISKFKGFVKVFGKDKQTLLSEIKIGESLAMGCELEKDEIGLYIASLDVSASCGFKLKEWENFVQGVNEANKNLKEIYKG
ncbi:hypothetical protein ES695_17910 [Candidatus Atribacteria bacterium 1244-E10-H5-B2]|nr:MAG: hypothetical protein ES695_17910 [Candidatus Atribacteria bacterium 1244-E10-H5-B2]